MTQQILDVKEAAELLGMAPATLKRHARKNAIPAAKVGGAWRFHREQLEEWIRERAQRNVER
jgi:excisionase family DNA binding protein